MPMISQPIAQVIRNYITNLPIFPPADPGPAAVHRFMLHFYNDFQAAAEARGVAVDEQTALLERAQKVLWCFARKAKRVVSPGSAALEIDSAAAQADLKFPRAEMVFTLMGDLGAVVEFNTGGIWSPVGRLKTAEALRLRFTDSVGATMSGGATMRGGDLPPAFSDLAMRIQASQPKDKPAFERFLRANPYAVLTADKPPMDLPPDHPAILANLPAGAAAGWCELVRWLAEQPGLAPVVEFRNIHHGLWTVNYNSKRGGRDLCGLIVQNSRMTVRVILYGAMHTRVGNCLDMFGDPVRKEYHTALWYEEFQHKWLFVPVECAADTVGIEKLLAMIMEG